MIGLVVNAPAVLVGLALAAGLCVSQESVDPPPRVEATVTRAVDGDSLDARVDGMRTALGFLGVAAPGLTQACGTEALARSQELVGDRVLLESDPFYELDERGRRLFYVFTADGVWVEEVLIREGLAFANRVDATHGPYLAQLQSEAEAAGVGCLWGGNQPHLNLL